MASTRKDKILSIIKDNNLVSDVIEKPGGVELVLKRKLKAKGKKSTYLSEALNETPHGFLYKDETGMGATTLELMANRNSIIVEPIKITASSKAYNHPGSMYVGGYTRYHPRKSTTEQEIEDYILDENIFPKKIIVVADSLHKVIKVLGELAYQHFFFLIDEIDSFQLDSTFRRSMEYALSVYKKFKSDSRAMLSATRIQFSDPILKKEPVTYVKYDKPIARRINVLTCPTGNVISSAAEVISNLLVRHPSDKFLIAFNSVSGCFDLAEFLTNNGFIPEKEITILCSKSSQERVVKYYKELETDKLPTRLTFITSAFFTGFDLYDKYHLVSLSSSLNKIFSLSERRLKQIAGRSRNKLLSETVIHDTVPADEKFNLTEKQLINSATQQLAAMRCIMMRFANNVLLNQHMGDITESIIKTFEEKSIGYIYLGQDDIYHISYLFIDAQLEMQRIRKTLYRAPDTLSQKLIQDGNVVRRKSISSSLKVSTQKVIQGNRESEMKEILEILGEAVHSYELEEMIEKGFLTSMQSTILKSIVGVFDYLDIQKIMPYISKALIGKRDFREFNNLMAKLSFMILPSGYLPVDRINTHFPLGMTLTKDEILYRMNLFIGELNIGKEITSSVKAIRMLKLYRRTTKIQRGNGIIDIKIQSKPVIPGVVIRQKQSIYNHDDLTFFTEYYRQVD